MRLWGVILLSLCLLLLSACSQNPVIVTRTVYVNPPVAFAADCGEPVMHGQDNEAHLNYTLDLRTTLRECNEDKRQLRKWRGEVTQ
ncbi:Rz1-like lysis system protein LysC [Pseudomaricurvus hydrocarbonicus]|uniref:Rz1-like lysis system protein LysC n=1 Tax=Pseudomaricurvus hydrocarbonicus TaxID=1470433 RepID=UPI003C7C5983